jgi:hypothetical protein
MKNTVLQMYLCTPLSGYEWGFLRTPYCTRFITDFKEKSTLLFDFYPKKWFEEVLTHDYTA